MNITLILSKLQGVTRNGDGWKARCPAHDDQTPSLSITEGDDGRTLLNVTPDARAEDICAKHEYYARRFVSPIETRRLGMSNRGNVMLTTIATAKWLFEVVRYEPKDFRQRRPDATALDGWTWNTKGVEKVLFRLPEILRDDSKRQIHFRC